MEEMAGTVVEEEEGKEVPVRTVERVMVEEMVASPRPRMAKEETNTIVLNRSIVERVGY
jgi:hypothetical protein